MSRSVLVTGVSGFVGGALGSHLRRFGYHVTGVSRQAPRADSCATHLKHDLCQSIPSHWPAADVVVHCAALASPWASRSAYHLNNVEATRNVITFAAKTQARFIFISSSSVHYTNGDQLNVTEDTPLPNRPINEYAATKRQAEALVRQSNLPWTILRPRAVFGPGDTVLFPRILRAAQRGQLPRITRPDGKSPLADLIYIENLSHYIERTIALDVEGTLNLTNNQPVELHSFLDGLLEKLALPKPTRQLSAATAMALARLAELTSQYLLSYKEPPVTRFGVEVMAYSKTFDVTKMLATLGPPPVSLDTGVDRFIAWHRAQ